MSEGFNADDFISVINVLILHVDNKRIRSFIIWTFSSFNVNFRPWSLIQQFSYLQVLFNFSDDFSGAFLKPSQLIERDPKLSIYHLPILFLSTMILLSTLIWMIVNFKDIYFQGKEKQIWFLVS